MQAKGRPQTSDKKMKVNRDPSVLKVFGNREFYQFDMKSAKSYHKRKNDPLLLQTLKELKDEMGKELQSPTSSNSFDTKLGSDARTVLNFLKRSTPTSSDT